MKNISRFTGPPLAELEESLELNYIKFGRVFLGSAETEGKRLTLSSMKSQKKSSCF